MNKINKFFVLIFINLMILLPAFVLAQTSGSGANDSSGSGGAGSQNYNIQIVNPFKTSTVEGLIKIIVDEILIPIGGVIAVVMIIYSGFLFVTARGNDAQITKAKESLKWAVIGSAILIGAWVISEAISGTIGELRR